jgi:hypothetical protein
MRGGPCSTNTLRLCISRASATIDASASDQVRSALASYVEELRDDGLPIEKAISAVKQVAADVGVRPSSDFPLADVDLASNDRLLVNLVTWTVLHYYAQHGHALTSRTEEQRTAYHRPSAIRKPSY